MVRDSQVSTSVCTFHIEPSHLVLLDIKENQMRYPNGQVYFVDKYYSLQQPDSSYVSMEMFQDDILEEN